MKKTTKKVQKERQSELARLGISQATFYNWKSGRTQIPTYILTNEVEFLEKFIPEYKTIKIS